MIEKIISIFAVSVLLMVSWDIIRIKFLGEESALKVLLLGSLLGSIVLGYILST